LHDRAFQYVWRVSQKSTTNSGEAVSGSKIDRHLGRRILEARSHRDQSLDALAQMIDVDPAVLNAMETGQSRIASLLLARVSRALDFPLGWFFEGLPGQDVFETPSRVRRSV